VRTRSASFILICAGIVLSASLPATADEARRPNATTMVVGGRPMSAEEMSHVRGAYSRVSVRINGTTYTAEDPAPTGSASLVIPLGTNTYSRVRASTTNGGTATSTVTISGSVTFRTSP
jgi:hypothetical protein